MIKLEQEQVNLIVKLNDHKTQVNKLAEQLIQEEKREKDIESKIFRTQGQIKLYQEQLKDQNISLQSKDQVINKQKMSLDDLTKELEKQKKVENETLTRFNALNTTQVNTEKEVQEKAANLTILQKELNQTKNQTELLKKEVEKKEIEFKNELNEEKVLKERQEIVNKRLNDELTSLKETEETQKNVTNEKMKKIENEFVEK